MRRMTRPRDSLPPAIATASIIPQRLQGPLLWAGAVLCVAGFAWHRTWEHWAPGRFFELIVLALVSLALAWPLQRFARASWATALACIWIAALVVFADPLPVLAVALVAAMAVVIGGWIAGAGAPIALACACGLALLAGVLGWLLPLPVHFRWSYLALCAVVVGIGHRDLLARLKVMRKGWSEAISLHPRAAALGVLALGLASTGCWLPTMQFDDLAYHLGLPWQLMTSGRYALDPTHQVWALAPWAADVQQALPQVIAGAEARGPLNALWIAITAAGLWRLGAALDLDAPARWGAIALYASLPLTAGLAAGMQTETATTALLVWLAWLVARPGSGAAASSRTLWAGAVLVGGLLGLKLMGAVYAGVLLVYAALVRRQWPAPSALLTACVIALAVAGSSYVYAGVVAGNPFLPLLNASFQSPFFAPSDFQDARWHAGLSPLLPWEITFSTRAYSETLPGSAGFVIVALAGAWLLALASRRTRALALAATTMLVLVFLPLQYLRYAFPALVLLLPALAAASVVAAPRGWGWLLAGVAVLGFAFQANGNWMQRNGALKETVVAAGRDAPLLFAYAPERLFAARLRGADTPVLFLDGKAPAYAELGVSGRTTAWYSPALWRAAAGADNDASGARWAALIEQAGTRDIILRRSTLSPAQSAALQRVRAIRHATAGDAQWWKIPAEAQP